MNDRTIPRYYSGAGGPANEREIDRGREAMTIVEDEPADYLASPALRDAVNVALMLCQPLLVTGEPGTGKTQLAASVAHDLGLAPPLMFRTKTTSTARDLFYRYDSLRHFHDAQFRREHAPPTEAYIRYEALGLAILLSLEPEQRPANLPEHLGMTPPTRSVVLVDEFDKAPRDLPNDVLNEVEQMTFEVPELGVVHRCDPALRPIIIFTSNSEKNLPDAFLRRCVYFHIEFPGESELLAIVNRRLKNPGSFSPEKIVNAIRRFQLIREQALKKPPATAELLAWLRVLQRLDIDVDHPRDGEAELLAITYAALIKNEEDRSRVQ